MHLQKSSEIPEEFFRVCTLKELSDNTGKRFFVNDTEIAVFKINGEIFALSNTCPHQHSSVIYDGIIEEGYVLCPVHGWKFSLADGKLPSGSGGLDSYEVILSGNDVYIKVIKKELNW